MATESRTERAENRLLPRPNCRAVMPGGTASFRVRAEGAGISSLRVVPCEASASFPIRLAGAGLEAPVRGGEELTLEIDTPRGTPLA